MTAWYALVARYAREVVAQRLAVITLITGVLHVAVAVHWVSAGWSDTAVAQVTGGLDLLGVLTAGVLVRRVVTPTKDPRDGTGEPLMPVSDHIAALAAVAEPPVPPARPAPGPLVTGTAAPAFRVDAPATDFNSFTDTPASTPPAAEAPAEPAPDPTPAPAPAAEPATPAAPGPVPTVDELAAQITALQAQVTAALGQPQPPTAAA